MDFNLKIYFKDQLIEDVDFSVSKDIDIIKAGALHFADLANDYVSYIDKSVFGPEMTESYLEDLSDELETPLNALEWYYNRVIIDVDDPNYLSIYRWGNDNSDRQICGGDIIGRLSSKF